MLRRKAYRQPKQQLILLDTSAFATDLRAFLWCFRQESKVKAVLEGHLGNVNCAEFCPHYTSTLVSASDDRTFRVCDADVLIEKWVYRKMYTVGGQSHAPKPKIPLYNVENHCRLI